MPKRSHKVPPPRPDLIALLQTCKDDLDDDTPRLILADWLEDHGETARAEFIRVQCEASHLTLAPVGIPINSGGSILLVQCEANHLTLAPEQLKSLARREGELLVQFGIEWTQPLIDWAAAWEWRRGMCYWATPKLEVTRNSATVARLFPRAEQLAWVEGLHLDIFGDARIETITRLPQMKQIRRLRFHWGYWTSVEVASARARVLAASPSLKWLRELDIGETAVSDDAAIAICESPHLRNLEELHLFTSPAGNAKDTLTQRFGNRVHFKSDLPAGEPDVFYH